MQAASIVSGPLRREQLHLETLAGYEHNLSLLVRVSTYSNPYENGRGFSKLAAIFVLQQPRVRPRELARQSRESGPKGWRGTTLNKTSDTAQAPYSLGTQRAMFLLYSFLCCERGVGVRAWPRNPRSLPGMHEGF